MTRKLLHSQNRESLTSADVISFRHLLVDAMRDFLDGEGMNDEATASGLGEVLVSLSKYREEGQALYPSVFLCEDLAGMLAALGGREHLAVGSGPFEPVTMRKALKQCAPLGGNDWAIYLVRTGERLEYGLFRTDAFILSRTAMATLRELVDADVRIIGLVQLAESVLELRGSRGGRRIIYLSGADTEALPAIAHFKKLVDVATRDVPAAHRGKVARFFQRVFIDAARAPHGSLIAVIPKDASPRAVFADGIVLERPLRISELTMAHETAESEDARASLQGAGHLLEGMLGVDGITVLATDGAVVGYNAFINFGAEPSGNELATLGGARHRTFEVLTSMVGEALVGAFMRSQDGRAECRVQGEADP